VFPTLSRAGKLFTYRHDGFFKSMDTYKDQQELEDLLARPDFLSLASMSEDQSALQYFDYRALQQQAVGH